MDNWLKNLLDLQEVDLKIRNLNIRLNMIPVEIKNLNNELTSLKNELHSEKGILQKTELEIKQIESEVNIRNEKILTLEKQTLQVKKNDEYKALLQEVSYLKDEISTFETKEIEALDILDNAQTAFKNISNDLKIKEKIIKEERKELEEIENDINKQLKINNDKREAQSKKIDEDYLRKYNMILSKNSGSPLTKVHGNNCGNCHLKLMPQTLLIARKAQFILCEHCSYIIHF